MIDQAFVSGGSFLTSVILARSLGIHKFGEFSLIWIILLIVNSMHMALVVHPLMSIAPRKKDIELDIYYKGTFYQQLIFLIFSTIVILITVFVYSMFIDHLDANLIISVAILIFSYHFQDYFRRYYFTGSKVVQVMFNDIFVYGVRTLFLYVIGLYVSINVLLSLHIISVFYLLGGIFFYIRYPKKHLGFSYIRDVSLVNWSNSKWLLPSGIMQWTSLNVFMLAAAKLLDPSSVGIMRLGQSILSVSHVVLQSLENTVPMKVSRIYVETGKTALKKYLLSFSLIGICCILALIIPLHFIADTILILIYGNKYANYGYVISWYSCIYLCTFLMIPVSSGIRTLDITRIWFVAYVIASVLSLILVYPLEMLFQIHGALAGILIANIALLSVSIYALARYINSSSETVSMFFNTIRITNSEGPYMRKIIRVDARSLLNHNRIDLVIKYNYVKYYLRQIKSKYAVDLYLEHIKLFNHYYETDGSGKIGKENFLDSFHSLIKSIADHGIMPGMPIPVSKDGVLIDGSHRVAIAIYLGLEVDIEIQSIEVPKYNIDFFIDRGLKKQYVDYIASEYSKLCTSTRFVLIWPSSAESVNEAVSIIDKNCNIIFKKEMFLSKNGQINLIRYIYSGEPWLGSGKDNFIGAINKANWCFASNINPLRLYLVETECDLLDLKQRLRDIFKIDKHSVHINDTHCETITISNLLLNANSIEVLNVSNFYEYKWFDKLIHYYFEYINCNSLDTELLCLSGSAPLAVLGLREVRDLDFLHIDKVESSCFKEISSHNNELHFYNKTLDEIIFNPENHFYYKNLKTVSIDNLKTFKINRNEAKDIQDIQLLDNLINNKSTRISIVNQLLLCCRLSYVKGRVKFLLLKIRFNITILIRKMSLKSSSGF